jgi:high-affinity iron transporter
VQSSLLTGVLGLQPKPVLIEVVGWVLYVLIVGGIVLWPAGKPFPRRRVGLVSGALAAGAAVAALVVFLTAPATPSLPPTTLAMSVTQAPTTSGILAGTTMRAPDGVAVTVDDATAESATGSLQSGDVTTPMPRLSAIAPTTFGTVAAPGYTQVISPAIPVDALVTGAPTTVTLAQVVAANDGRIPVGLDTQKFGASAPVVYAVTATVTVALDPYFHRPLAARVIYAITATATPERGAATVLGRVGTVTASHEPTSVELTALDSAHTQQLDHESQGVRIPLTLTVVAVVLALVAAALLFIRRHRTQDPAATEAPLEEKEHTR